MLRASSYQDRGPVNMTVATASATPMVTNQGTNIGSRAEIHALSRVEKPIEKLSGGR